MENKWMDQTKHFVHLLIIDDLAADSLALHSPTSSRDGSLFVPHLPASMRFYLQLVCEIYRLIVVILALDVL